MLLQPADCAVGAMGRVCRLVEGARAGRVLVEAGAACRVIEVTAPTEVSSFWVGKLEELDEADLPAGSPAVWVIRWR